MNAMCVCNNLCVGTVTTIAMQCVLWLYGMEVSTTS